MIIYVRKASAVKPNVARLDIEVRETDNNLLGQYEIAINIYAHDTIHTITDKIVAAVRELWETAELLSVISGKTFVVSDIGPASVLPGYKKAEGAE